MSKTSKPKRPSVKRHAEVVRKLQCEIAHLRGELATETARREEAQAYEIKVRQLLNTAQQLEMANLKRWHKRWQETTATNKEFNKIIMAMLKEKYLPGGEPGDNVIETDKVVHKETGHE